MSQVRGGGRGRGGKPGGGNGGAGAGYRGTGRGRGSSRSQSQEPGSDSEDNGRAFRSAISKSFAAQQRNGASHTTQPEQPNGIFRGSKRPRGVFESNRGRKPSSLQQSQEPEDTDSNEWGNAEDMGIYYQTLKKQREKEREHAIANNLVDDPNKRRRLEDAITFVGTCRDMCPRFERVERVVQQAVDGCEKEENDDGEWAASHEKMIKRFRRSAAGDEAQLPSDVRPPPILKKTLDYLINDIVGGPQPLAKVHAFVWDRTRSIRNDFTLQNIHGSKNADLLLAIECYEVIARFHIHALHQLSNPDIDEQGFTAHNEREQLYKTLLTLVELYDLCATRKLPCKNEAEFRTYNIILHLHDQNVEREAMNLGRERRDIFEHPRIQKALELYAAAGNVYDLHGPLKPHTSNLIAQNNFSKFFRLVQSPSFSYTMACVAEIHFNQVRKNALTAFKTAFRSPATKEDCTMEHLQYLLGFDGQIQAQEFCEACGMTVSVNATGEAFLVLNSGPEPLSDPHGSLNQAFSKTVVDHKRQGRTLPDVIYGLTVRQARAAGRLSAPPDNDTSPNSHKPSNNGKFSPFATPFQPTTQKQQSPLSSPGSAFGSPAFGAPSTTSQPRNTHTHNPFAASQIQQTESFATKTDQQSTPFSRPVNNNFSSSNPFQQNNRPSSATANSFGKASEENLRSATSFGQPSFGASSFDVAAPESSSQPNLQKGPNNNDTRSTKSGSLFMTDDSDEEEERPEDEPPQPVASTPLFPSQTSNHSPNQNSFPPAQKFSWTPQGSTPTTSLFPTGNQAQAAITASPSKPQAPLFTRAPQESTSQDLSFVQGTPQLPANQQTSNVATQQTHMNSPLQSTQEAPSPQQQLPQKSNVQPRSILKTSRAPSPLRNELTAPEHDPAPKEVPQPPNRLEITDELVAWYLGDQGGLVQDLAEFVLPQLVAQAVDEHDIERALQFRERTLMERYFYRWRRRAQKLSLMKRGRNSRKRMSMLITEQRRRKRYSNGSASPGSETSASSMFSESSPPVARTNHQRSKTVDGSISSAMTSKNSASPVLGRGIKKNKKTSLTKSSFLSGQPILNSQPSSAHNAGSYRDNIKSDYWRLKAAGLHTLPNGVTEPLSLSNSTRKRKSTTDGTTPESSAAKRLVADSSMQASKERYGFKKASANTQRSSESSQRDSTAKFDQDEDELFAELEEVKKAMDQGIEWYREERLRDGSSLSPNHLGR